MTQRRITTTLGINQATIGFDHLFNQLENLSSNSQSQGYPPYNIVQVGDDNFTISLAVAGFSMNDIDITTEQNNLTVEGKSPKGDENVNYVHKGIAGRNFCKQFTLAEHVTVVGATLDLGMLSIRLLRVVPEYHQAKKITIESSHPSVSGIAVDK